MINYRILLIVLVLISIPDVNANSDIIHSLTDEDLKNFQDSTFTFKGGSYDFHDGLILEEPSTTISKDKIFITNLISNKEGSEVNIEIPLHSMGYYYVIDEEIKLTEVSKKYPLIINFLGKPLKIIEINGENELTAYVGEEYSLDVGETVDVEGKSVTLISVGQSAVVVDIDGVSKTISFTSPETVNGIEISIDELFYRTQVDQSSAILVMGEDSLKKIKDGDYFEDKCVGNNCWEWDIGELTSENLKGDIYSGKNGPTIGIVNKISEVKGDVGDEVKINLPYDYANILLNIDIAREDYDINIKNVDFEIIDCKEVKINAEIENEGRKKIENASVELKSAGLSLYLKTDKIDLNKKRDILEEFSAVFLEGDIESKEYPVEFVVHFDGKEESKLILMDLKKCGAKENNKEIIDKKDILNETNYEPILETSTTTTTLPFEEKKVYTPLVKRIFNFIFGLFGN